jgi:hypothetical protein
VLTTRTKTPHRKQMLPMKAPTLIPTKLFVAHPDLHLYLHP